MPRHGYPLGKAEKSALANNSQQNLNIPDGKTQDSSQVIQPLNPTKFIKMTGRMKSVALEELTNFDQCH